MDSRAALFASKGMAPTLALCHLSRQTCDGLRPLASRRTPTQETGNDNLVYERVLRFDGLEFDLLYGVGPAGAPPPAHWIEAEHEPMVLEMTVTSARWPIARGLRVGTSRRVVEKILGSRLGHVLGEDCDTYVDDETQAVATVCYAAGKVRSIKWTAWWDG
jgi:hypothetical protein